MKLFGTIVWYLGIIGGAIFVFAGMSRVPPGSEWLALMLLGHILFSLVDGLK